MNFMMLTKKKVQQLKKERMFIKWQSLIKPLQILGGKQYGKNSYIKQI